MLCNQGLFFFAGMYRRTYGSLLLHSLDRPTLQLDHGTAIDNEQLIADIQLVILDVPVIDWCAVPVLNRRYASLHRVQVKMAYERMDKVTDQVLHIRGHVFERVVGLVVGHLVLASFTAVCSSVRTVDSLASRVWM